MWHLFLGILPTAIWFKRTIWTANTGMSLLNAIVHHRLRGGWVSPQLYSRFLWHGRHFLLEIQGRKETYGRTRWTGLGDLLHQMLCSRNSACRCLSQWLHYTHLFWKGRRVWGPQLAWRTAPKLVRETRCLVSETWGQPAVKNEIKLVCSAALLVDLLGLSSGFVESNVMIQGFGTNWVGRHNTNMLFNPILVQLA
jgi:hypothetical protein